MLPREKLEQLSEEELENLYQQKKTELEQKLGKSRRIRGMLSKKVDEKQKNVENLKNQISELLEANPDLKLKYNSLSSELKQDFDDIDQDPAELNRVIQEKQKTISHLQSKKLHIERTITETSNHIEQQKALEELFQQEIASLISQSEPFSAVDENSELLELNQLSKEINSAQDEFEAITNEIEDIREKVHHQG